MMKRVTWFVGGAVAGAAGAGYAKQAVSKRAKRTAAKLNPATLAKKAGNNVAGAVREGRAAMKAREAELRARRDHQVVALDQQLDPGDQLLVDGQPVDSGRVYVLKRK
ncbi:MAG TPA: hypothetical protein VNQ73_22910 [Ilumatobacter sp.]|nr:hypothetical protein [Ilumatobacter sp.]